MIDFAHVFEILDGGIDEGYNKGIANLITLFQRIREGKTQYYDPAMNFKLKHSEDPEEPKRGSSKGTSTPGERLARSLSDEENMRNEEEEDVSIDDVTDIAFSSAASSAANSPALLHPTNSDGEVLKSPREQRRKGMKLHVHKPGRKKSSDNESNGPIDEEKKSDKAKTKGKDKKAKQNEQLFVTSNENENENSEGNVSAEVGVLTASPTLKRALEAEEKKWSQFASNNNVYFIIFRPIFNCLI